MVWLFTNPLSGFGEFWFTLAFNLGLTNLLPNTLTLEFVVKTVAFGMGVVGSAIWNFTLYKLWAFKED
jgi:putative flippase GtrA